MNEDYVGSLTIKYIIQEGSAVILSCSGSGGYLKLPDAIAGKPVRKLGDYCFSAPEEGMRNLTEKNEIKEIRLEGADDPFRLEALVTGKALKEICLPAELSAIGEYAFYNCTELEGIILGGGRLDFGNGAFMNCDNLRNLKFLSKPGNTTVLAGFLREIQGELKVTFESGEEKAVFLFPEFYEESVENTPARVFHYLIHGAGYRYRQCLERGILNIDMYDSLFSTPEIQTEENTALDLALNRLKYPYQLTPGHRRQYIRYLLKHREETISRYIQENDTEGLGFLKEEEILAPEWMDYAVRESIRRKQPECTGFLLNLLKERTKEPRDKFEL